MLEIWRNFSISKFCLPNIKSRENIHKKCISQKNKMKQIFTRPKIKQSHISGEKKGYL